MAIIIDILLLLIVFLSVFIGVKRGFIKSVKGIVALILAVIAANSLSPYLASYFKENLFEEAIRSNVERQFDQIVTIDSDTGEYDGIGEMIDRMPSEFSALLSRFHIDPDNFKSFYEDTAKKQGDNIRQQVINYVVDPIVSSISSALAYAVVFLLTIVVVLILAMVLNLVCKLPLLSQANRILGLIAGIISGLLYAWVAAIVISTAWPYLGVLNPTLFPGNALEHSFVFGLLYKLNPLRYLLRF